MHVVIDAAVIAVSYISAWLLKFVSPFFEDSVRSLSFEWYMLALIPLIPAYLILYYAFGLYTPKNSRRKQAAAAVRLLVMRRSRRIRFWPLSGEGDNSIISITVSPTW